MLDAWWIIVSSVQIYQLYLKWLPTPSSIKGTRPVRSGDAVIKSPASWFSVVLYAPWDDSWSHAEEGSMLLSISRWNGLIILKLTDVSLLCYFLLNDFKWYRSLLYATRAPSVDLSNHSAASKRINPVNNRCVIILWEQFLVLLEVFRNYKDASSQKHIVAFGNHPWLDMRQQHHPVEPNWASTCLLLRIITHIWTHRHDVALMSSLPKTALPRDLLRSHRKRFSSWIQNRPNTVCFTTLYMSSQPADTSCSYTNNPSHKWIHCSLHIIVLSMRAS